VIYFACSILTWFPQQREILEVLVQSQGDRDPYVTTHGHRKHSSYRTAQANVNLSDAQKTLLMLHGRLGHVGFRKLQWMELTGRIKVRNSKMSALVIL
jgi:acetylornithine deacetylase/succinyl-diaminopimelate desuccinylase-like protein